VWLALRLPSNTVIISPKVKKIAQFELLQREKHPAREYPFFNDFAYQWFERKKATWKNSYRNTIQNVLDKYLIPQFGNLNDSAVVA